MPATPTFGESSQQMKSVASVLSVLGKALSTNVPLPHPATPPSLSNIQLPQAPSIATILKTNCIKHSLSRELTRSYERHVSDLRKCTEAQIQRLMQYYQDNVISYDILEKQITRYISLYKSGLEHWCTLLSNEIKAVKSEFNAERVPLLITYFKYNAYPSTHDRNWLARETSNTPQQISIWFQNRRRRSRKAGVELKRASPDEIPHNLFTEGSETCPPHPLPTPLAKRPRTSSPEVTTVEEVPLVNSSLSDTSTPRLHKRLRTCSDSTDSTIPPYPTYKHPATPSYWLRPTETQFPEPIWDRKPASYRNARPARSNTVSVDDLSSMVASKLRLFCSHSPPSPASNTAWHTMLYTHPSPAPLPAFVRAEVTKQPYLTTIAYMQPTNRLSLKRKRSETNENEEPPPSRSKHFRSLSTSSYSSFTAEDYRSSDNSSCDSSSPGPQTPLSAPLSLLPPPRFVDWSKFSIPTIPQAYGLY